MRNHRAKTRNTILVYPSGVNPGISGLEIKDRTTEAQKKDEKGLRGFFVPDAGFFLSREAAVGKAQTFSLLKSYQNRLFRAGLLV